MVKTSVLLAGTVLGAASLVALPLVAQTETSEPAPLTQDGARWHFDAAGHRFTIPFPDWLREASRAVDESKAEA